jgi:F0F1-type ATP synthase membrane subunit b/b'
MLLKRASANISGEETMIFYSFTLPLCVVLTTVLGLAALYFMQKSISLTRELASAKLARARTTAALALASARIEELQRVGHEMYLQLGEKAEKAAYLDHIVRCLEERISHLASQAASMNAKRLAEEKRELGAYVIELLINVFFPGKCRSASGI